MTSKTNTYEGQPSGTAWASGSPSGGGSGDAWDNLTTAGTFTAIYDSAWSMHGTQSLHITGQASSQFILRSTGYNNSRLSARIYVRLVSSSGAQDIVQVRNGSGQAAALGFSSSRVVQVKNALGNAVYTFTSPALAYLTAYRMEIQVNKGVATAAPFDGTIAASLFAGDSTTPIETYSSSAVNAGTGNLVEWRAGKLTSAPSLEMFLDSTGAADGADFLGPYMRVVSGLASVPLAASGTGRKVAVAQGAAVVPLTAAGAGVKRAAGSGTAAVTVTATGTGRKLVAGAGTAVAQLAAAGAGQKRGAGGAVAAVPVTAAGVGQKRAAGGGYGTITLSATGAGQKRIAGAGTATVTVTAAGTGSKRAAGAGTATVQLAAAGTGQKRAAGGGYAIVVIIATGAGHAVVDKPFTVTVGPGQTRPGAVVGQGVTRQPSVGAGQSRYTVTVGPGREA